MPERARQVAAALLDHISRIGKRRGGEHAAAAAEMGIEKTLRSIHIVRCHDAMEQVAAIKALPSLLDAREGRVRAIIVDSMAFHFRHDSVAVGVAVRKAVARAKGADERTASEVSPLYRNENCVARSRAEPAREPARGGRRACKSDDDEGRRRAGRGRPGPAGQRRLLPCFWQQSARARPRRSVGARRDASRAAAFHHRRSAGGEALQERESVDRLGDLRDLLRRRARSAAGRRGRRRER